MPRKIRCVLHRCCPMTCCSCPAASCSGPRPTPASQPRSRPQACRPGGLSEGLTDRDRAPNCSGDDLILNEQQAGRRRPVPADIGPCDRYERLPAPGVASHGCDHRRTDPGNRRGGAYRGRARLSAVRRRCHAHDADQPPGAGGGSGACAGADRVGDARTRYERAAGGGCSMLAVRARMLGRAITLCTFCALLVSMVVVALFVGAFVSFHLSLDRCGAVHRRNDQLHRRTVAVPARGFRCHAYLAHRFARRAPRQDVGCAAIAVSEHRQPVKPHQS